MKKSILSIVAIAFAAVSVFTSCDKNDDNINPTPTPSTLTATQDNSASYFNCAYLISDDMAANAKWTVTITDGTKSSDYDIAAQGKYGTYTIDNVQMTGYLFTFTKPAGDNVKATVKYTLNDKAKALTADDMINSTCASAQFSSTTATPTYADYLRAVVMKNSQGDHADEVYQSILKLWNR